MGKWLVFIEERFKLFKNKFIFGRVKFFFIGNIFVFDWFVIVIGDFEVEYSFDLVE